VWSPPLLPQNELLVSRMPCQAGGVHSQVLGMSCCGRSRIRRRSSAASERGRRPAIPVSMGATANSIISGVCNGAALDGVCSVCRRSGGSSHSSPAGKRAKIVTSTSVGRACGLRRLPRNHFPPRDRNRPSVEVTSQRSVNLRAVKLYMSRSPIGVSRRKDGSNVGKVVTLLAKAH
jgi:hypothetical protein